MFEKFPKKNAYGDEREENTKQVSLSSDECKLAQDRENNFFGKRFTGGGVVNFSNSCRISRITNGERQEDVRKV